MLCTDVLSSSFSLSSFSWLVSVVRLRFVKVWLGKQLSRDTAGWSLHVISHKHLVEYEGRRVGGRRLHFSKQHPMVYGRGTYQIFDRLITRCSLVRSSSLWPTEILQLSAAELQGIEGACTCKYKRV